MKATLASTTAMEWAPGSALYGHASIHDGRELVHVKVLADRRADGGGIAFLVKFTPPQGKLIKLVAVARSDEHVYLLEGGYCNKSGTQLRFPGDYAFNPTGHPHSAFVGMQVVSLVVYTGDTDQIRTFEVIDPTR